MTRRMTTRAAALAAVLATVAACGVDPSDIADAGSAPVISARAASANVYLLSDGRLTSRTVPTASDGAQDVLAALFQVGQRPQREATALGGFRLEQTVLGRYGVERGVRNDPENPVGLRLHVIVYGPGRLPRTALAQITCTARLSEEIWAVKITQTTSKGPLAMGEHTCSEYHDLAAPGVNLPP